MLICGVGFLGFAAAYFWPSAARSPDSAAVAQLAELGWGVQPQKDGIRFELSSRPLPSMARSAELFHKLGAQFSIQLQGLPSLDGLHYLSGIDELTTLGISAGTFNDISEIKDLNLVELGVGVGQIPSLVNLANLPNLSKLRIIAQGNVDLGPVGTLSNLEYLWVWAGVSRFDIAPLHNLTKLRDFTLSVLGIGRRAAVDNIGTLGDFTELRRITISDIQITDLEFLKNANHLEEINLSDLPISSLEPLSGLKELKRVSINALPIVDISPLMDLPELTELRILRTPARADMLSALQRRGVKVQSD
jgi:Leucine-rich repeat (LRR) protein